MEYQLQSKGLRWLGHTFRMPDDGLPKKLLFGQVKDRCPPGCPRSNFNDVAVRDCQLRCIKPLYQQTLQGCSQQAALAGQDLSCTYLDHHELESVLVTIDFCIATPTYAKCFWFDAQLSGSTGVSEAWLLVPIFCSMTRCLLCSGISLRAGVAEVLFGKGQQEMLGIWQPFGCVARLVAH